MTTNQLIEALEPLVEQSSVCEVLEGLSEVCLGKAEHISANWQDNGLAKRWESAGNRIAAFSVKLTTGLCADTPGISE